MLSDLKIDFVTPPFAGHLFPCLQLASGLVKRAGVKARVFSTASAMSAIEACDLVGVELLEGREEEVFAIANPDEQVGSNPLRLLNQFRKNLALMPQLKAEFESHWSGDRPDSR